MSNNGVSGSGEFAVSGDIRDGVLHRRKHPTKEIKYSAINGNAVVDGDIVLGSVEKMEKAYKQFKDPDTVHLEGVFIVGTGFRWPGGVIPYLIDPTLPDPDRVRQAIAHWEQNTSIRFIERTTEFDHVFFQRGVFCQSAVGRQGGRQIVELGIRCPRGKVIHEIGHVVGLWHEQSREDRNNHVRIVLDNIDHDALPNFEQQIVDGDDFGPYDYGSIMHYPADAFAIDTTRPTIITPHGEAIGQRERLSDGDIATVNFLYS